MTRPADNPLRDDYFDGQLGGAASRGEEGLKEWLNDLRSRVIGLGGGLVTVVNASTYTVEEDDSIVHVAYSATGISTITIPSEFIESGIFRITIKDGGGNAFNNPIAITAEGSETIDGQATYYINDNYNSVLIYSNGTNLFAIGSNSEPSVNEIGGRMVQLTNKTGAASIKGTVVVASDTTDGAFEVSGAEEYMPIGIVYEAGVADGSLCWITIDGPADVLLEDTTGSTHGYWVKTSDTQAGRADASNVLPPGGTIAALEEHARELGHSGKTVVGGTNVMCRINCHFN